jgi:hypothetical protein
MDSINYGNPNVKIQMSNKCQILGKEFGNLNFGFDLTFEL